MLKLSANPPTRSGPVDSVARLSGRWWVAHTKPRCEKAFAWGLQRRGIGYFLPMTRRVRFSGGRKRRVMLPLFPSYVFFCGDAESRSAALATNRLCRTLEVADQGRLVVELSAIEKALDGEGGLEACPAAAVGQPCRITSGPFEGIEGIVARRDGSARIVLDVHVLGQGACMEIDADLLEPIGPEAATARG